MSWKSRERHQATSFKAKSTHKIFARFKCHSLFQRHWSKCQICHITSFSLSCVVSLILGPLQRWTFNVWSSDNYVVRWGVWIAPPLFCLFFSKPACKSGQSKGCNVQRAGDSTHLKLFCLAWGKLSGCLSVFIRVASWLAYIALFLRGSKFSSVLGHPVTLAKITKEKSARMSLQNWVTIGPQFHYLSSLSTPHSKYI